MPHPAEPGDQPDVEIDLRDDPSPAGARDRFIGDFAPLGEALPVGVLGAVGMGNVVYANRRATEVLGRSQVDLTGSRWAEAFHAHDRASLIDTVALVLDSLPRQRLTLRLADDVERWVELVVTGLGPEGDPSGWIATVDDVSERVHAEHRLAHQATHDPLTRLPNRTLLVDRLHQAELRMVRAERSATVVVLFIDLDDFKQVNDRHGHAVGDQVLVEVASRLVRSLRTTDTVARFGGDEFVAACEVDGPDDVDHLVARLSQAIAEPCVVSGGHVLVTASIGVAVARSADEAIDRLLERADRDMYEHKAAAKAGRRP